MGEEAVLDGRRDDGQRADDDVSCDTFLVFSRALFSLFLFSFSGYVSLSLSLSLCFYMGVGWVWVERVVIDVLLAAAAARGCFGAVDAVLLQTNLSCWTIIPSPFFPFMGSLITVESTI